MLADGQKRCSCGAGCATWGQCMRGKSLRIEGCRAAVGGQDRSTQKRWDAELQAYRDARAQGIQPAGTSMAKVQEAVDISNKYGKAFDATNGVLNG